MPDSAISVQVSTSPASAAQRRPEFPHHHGAQHAAEQFHQRILDRDGRLAVTAASAQQQPAETAEYCPAPTADVCTAGNAKARARCPAAAASSSASSSSTSRASRRQSAAMPLGQAQDHHVEEAAHQQAQDADRGDDEPLRQARKHRHQGWPWVGRRSGVLRYMEVSPVIEHARPVVLDDEAESGPCRTRRTLASPGRACQVDN